MAKRRRLVASAFGAAESVSDTAETAGEAAVQMPVARAALGPGFPAPPIARVAAETAAEAALAELSQAMAQARAEGRLVQALPLAAVEPDHLLRDRIETDEEELAHLIASIRDHGQRSPIEVTELAPGRYGLISGWRRLKALARLQAETGEARFGSVLALLRRPETAAAAYVAMIEENEVRQGLSYYERARVAARAADLGVFADEKQALQRLFAAASRARRSKIGSFVTLYRALDGALRFPAAIPERLGLALAQRIAAAPEEVAALCAGLQADPPASAAAEQARLARFAAGPRAAPARREVRRELRPGLFLAAHGSGAGRVLALSGPGVDAAFRARLEAWLAGGGGA